jgi:hypothetical protein
LVKHFSTQRFNDMAVLFSPPLPGNPSSLAFQDILNYSIRALRLLQMKESKSTPISSVTMVQCRRVHSRVFVCFKEYSMKAIHLVLLSAILLCWAPHAPAQTELPPAAKEVAKQFADETVEIEKKAETEAKKRWDKTTVELKKLQDAYCRDAKLDEAVAVRDLIRSIQAGNFTTPTGELPAAAREVCKEHEEVLAELHKKTEIQIKKRQDQAAVELKKLQDMYCKEAKLDEAVAVRDLIKTINAGTTNALPDPGLVNNPVADIGKVFYYQVTANTAGQAIYGTDIYVPGSHLGLAAVHCGLLKEGQTGILKVTILPGKDSYAATTRNGVTSNAYGQCMVSFKVERPYAWLVRPPVTPLADPGTLMGYRREVGKSILFEVTGSDAGGIWGTGVFTDDSVLAKAAVHAGILAVGQKGVVKVTILPGQDSYDRTTSNGVMSGWWGNWSGSYRVELAQ